MMPFAFCTREKGRYEFAEPGHGDYKQYERDLNHGDVIGIQRYGKH
jgi:hypothetical protein